MRFFASTLALLCTAAEALAASSSSYPQQHVLGAGSALVRPAVEADLDDFVTVFIDAFAPGPVRQYVYPNLDRYRDLFWHCRRDELRRAFSNLGNTTFVNVIAKPGGAIIKPRDAKPGETADLHTHGHGHGPEEVVSIAVWNLLTADDDDVPPSDTPTIFSLFDAATAKCSDHPEQNATRALDFYRQMQAAEQRLVHDRRSDQLYLALLATHPDWDGHGFGAAHLRWGLDKAGRADEGLLPVTLMATPAGWPLYESAGFDGVENVTISMLDGLGELWMMYMTHEQV